LVRNKKLRLKKITIENTKSIDVYSKDAFGEEHVIYPGEKKTIIVLKKEK